MRLSGSRTPRRLWWRVTCAVVLPALVLSIYAAPLARAQDAPSAEAAQSSPGTDAVHAAGAADPTGAGAPSNPPAGYDAAAGNAAGNIDAIAQSLGKTNVAVNMMWMLLAGFLVMFMQAGFALVETGLCRAKNAGSVMGMNFLVYSVGMTGFFVCGYALMCGGSSAPASINAAGSTMNSMFTVGDKGWGLFGTTGFFLTGKAYDAGAVAWFLFMMVFMDTTATIPTGALAERWTYKSFFLFSLCIGGFLYPVYGCWVWGGGWLSQLGTLAGLGHGAVDYAGSGVVHMQGGMLALVCAWLLGPRIGKYAPDGTPRAIPGHNMPYVFLGTFILAFGWFGFNAGSSLAADGRIGIVAVNTMLASASGALSSCLYMWTTRGKPDPSMMCNGMLAGLVAITAPCAFVAPWAAFVIGLIAGVLVVWSVFFFDRAGIDDPCGAISVHGINGAWGLISLALLADGTYGDGYNGVAGGVVGVFYNATAGLSQLWAQLIDVGANAAWNILIGGLVFFVIGKIVSHRPSAADEIAGLDLPELGVPAYPIDDSGFESGGLGAGSVVVAPGTGHGGAALSTSSL